MKTLLGFSVSQYIGKSNPWESQGAVGSLFIIALIGITNDHHFYNDSNAFTFLEVETISSKNPLEEQTPGSLTVVIAHVIDW